MHRPHSLIFPEGRSGGSLHRLYLPRKLGERYYHVALLLEKSGVKLFVQIACSRVQKCCSLCVTCFLSIFRQESTLTGQQRQSIPMVEQRPDILRDVCGSRIGWSGYSGLFEPTEMTAAILKRH